MRRTSKITEQLGINPAPFCCEGRLLKTTPPVSIVVSLSSVATDFSQIFIALLLVQIKACKQFVLPFPGLFFLNL